MIRKLFAPSVFVLALGIGFGCSKKSQKTDGDMGQAGMQPTDLSSQMGAPIPELAAVYFEYDSFSLTAASRAALAGHAAWLKSNPSRMVQIEGHCDERGTTEFNLALGERRAATTRDFLVSQGVPAGQLSTISYGEERPAAMGSTESAWSKNRRAEFVSGGR